MWRVKMKHLKNTTFISVFLLLFGTAFIIQCDRSSEMDRTNDDQYEQSDTLRDEGDMQQDQQNQTDTLQNRGDREMQQDQSRQDTIGTQSQSDTLGGQNISYQGEMDFEDQREYYVNSLSDLRTEIDTELDALRHRIDQGNEENNQELEDRYNELTQVRTDLDSAIDNAQNSTAENWEEVKTETEELYNDVASRLEDENYTS